MDSTSSRLRGGVEKIAIDQAVADIRLWRRRLETSSSPQFAPVVRKLETLEAQLTEGGDANEVHTTLGKLAEQVRLLVKDGVGAGVSDKLGLLSQLLAVAGRRATD